MNDNFHISNVHLSGYRTLKDVNIDFVPGLNVIIGNNGVGKSNFLRFLNSIVNLELEDYSVLDCGFTCQEGDKSEKWEISQNFKREDEKRFIPNLQFKITDKEGKVSDFTSVEQLGSYDGAKLSQWFFSDYLPHTVHIEDREFLTKPFECKSIDNLFLEYRNRNDLPYYIKALLVKMSFEIIGHRFDMEGYKTVEQLKERIEQIGEFDLFSNILKKISGIQKFRFKKDFEVKVIGTDVRVQNLQFEFFVNEEWILYNGLSDGTKRLFNLTIDTSYPDMFMGVKGNWAWNKFNRVILIEEPELGIHPHQLSKLMRFVKSESEKRQIIITTHSPDVLDVLGKEDLHRIIIAYYDSEKGTQLRHLTDDEKKKATTYLENEAFLSDYWKHSTLEAR